MIWFDSIIFLRYNICHIAVKDCDVKLVHITTLYWVWPLWPICQPSVKFSPIGPSLHQDTEPLPWPVMLAPVLSIRCLQLPATHTQNGTGMYHYVKLRRVELLVKLHLRAIGGVICPMGSQRYCHPVTRNKWTHPALTSAPYRLDLPTPEG